MPRGRPWARTPLVTRRRRPLECPGTCRDEGPRGLDVRAVERAVEGELAMLERPATDDRIPRGSTAGRPSGAVSTTAAADPRLGDPPDPGDIVVIWAD